MGGPTTNTCNSASLPTKTFDAPCVSNTQQIANGCTNIFNVLLNGDSICQAYGGPEWSIDLPLSFGGSCYYYNCFDGETLAPGPNVACGNCNSQQGIPIFCKRTQFKGDPTACCFMDEAYNSGNFNNWPTQPLAQPNSCFADQTALINGVLSFDTTHRNTCDPQYRDITSSTCQSSIFNYCTGGDLTNPLDTRWLDRWTSSVSYCRYAFNRITSNSPLFLYTDAIQPPDGTITTNGYIAAKKLMGLVFDRYTSQGFRLDAQQGTNNYHPIAEIFKSICKYYPGMCGTVLGNTCAIYTSNDILRNPSLVQWCGCYLPEIEYDQYTKLQVPKECSPLCNRPNIVKLVEADQITIKDCKSSICLLDNINVTLTNAEVGNGLGVSQICGGGSAAQSYQCIFSDITIDVVNSSIGGGFNIEQNCTGSSICYVTDPSNPNNKIQKPCSDVKSPTEIQQEAQAALDAKSKTTKFWITMGIILGFTIILAIVMIIVFKLTKNKNFRKK